MKITKEELKKIIKEEISKIKESPMSYDDYLGVSGRIRIPPDPDNPPEIMNKLASVVEDFNFLRKRGASLQYLEDQGFSQENIDYALKEKWIHEKDGLFYAHPPEDSEA